MLPGLFYKRLKIIIVVVMLCITAICFKLSYNTIFLYNTLKTSAEDLWNRSFPIKAERGKILDVNNNILVDNEPTISIYAVPNQIKDKERTSKILSSYIDMKEEDIYSRISKRASSVTFHPNGKKISYEESNKISKENLDGIFLIQDTLRKYPYNEYMASLLGFVGIDNIGFAGLESYYNSYLQGKDGTLSYMMDAKGGLFSNKYYTLVSPSSGLNLKLTLDINIQNILERELNNAFLGYSASEVMGIVMNPNNGEILAIGNRPTYNNNNYQDYSQEIYNRLLPVYNSFEPGSTFKAMTFAAALNENLIDMHKDTYYDKGYEIVSGQRIKSWKKGGHGLQTYLEVLQNSSNPGFVSLSRKLGNERMYQYVKNFGFLEKTGVDIQGENKGIFFSKDNFHELECATTSFGQGISVTAIQLVSAFSSVINGGYLYTPKIAKSLISSNNETIYEFKPQLKRQVISNETSEKMRYALECVVAKGSGRKAFVDGYRIGGKTGTAQIAENGVYKDGAYILSFIAGAPMNNPQVVVYFSIKEPHNCIQYGGTTVGPIIQRIMSEILDYNDIEKDYENEINKTLTWMDEKTTIVPNYIGQEKKKIKNNLLKFSYYGEGNIVIDQIPKVGTIVPEGSTIMIQLGN
ncbi:MAG: PASTA domain-containing protein [Erysipelotrichaceae bacterium]|nr:PASTA domain-containing protein [Erysipelotrichaceae bacterium]